MENNPQMKIEASITDTGIMVDTGFQNANLQDAMLMLTTTILQAHVQAKEEVKPKQVGDYIAQMLQILVDQSERRDIMEAGDA